MELITLIVSSIALLLVCIVLIFVIKNKRQERSSISNSDLKIIKESINESINLLSNSISSLVAEKNSSILNEVNRNNEDIKNRIEAFEKEQKEFIDTIKMELSKIENELNDFKLDFINKYTEQKEQIIDKVTISLKEKLDDFKTETNNSLKSLNDSVKDSFKDIREDNRQKLDEINKSVNEKLQKTLEDKLNDSFKSVIEGIGSVNQAVGEIKGIATDVGSLKNVLTNVKAKGIMGEVILGNIIKEFLTSNQYVENYPTKIGSTERVEFAIKLPGSKDDPIYLPVDSKFPYEAYSVIHESNDIDKIKDARNQLRNNLLKYASDVSKKYIDVPNTTEFAIIFLPLEGLYLEALNMGLFEEIQNKYRVNLTGPTTFTAFINSLNMGFKSLMIQKKSKDVFKLLSAVKTEFNKFAETLEKTQKKVDDASKELDSLVGTRTRMINSKLRNITALDEDQTKEYFEETDIKED